MSDYIHEGRKVKALIPVLTLDSELAFLADQEAFREVVALGVARIVGSGKRIHKLQLKVPTSWIIGERADSETPRLIDLRDYGTRYIFKEHIGGADKAVNGYVYQFAKIDPRDRPCFHEVQRSCMTNQAPVLKRAAAPVEVQV